MKTYPSIDACIDGWVHHRERCIAAGKCGNVRFDGPVLYSYKEPIAVLNMAGTKVFRREYWFTNTTTRHTNKAVSAAMRAGRAQRRINSNAFTQSIQDLVFAE